MTVAGDAGRTLQRTPGRIKKLLADFYLLAGRLPDAVKQYVILQLMFMGKLMLIAINIVIMRPLIWLRIHTIIYGSVAQKKDWRVQIFY